MIKINTQVSYFILLSFQLLLGCIEKSGEVSSEQTCTLHTDCESMLCIEGTCYKDEVQVMDMTQTTMPVDAEQLTVLEDYQLARDMMMVIRDMRVVQDAESTDDDPPLEDMNLTMDNDRGMNMSCRSSCDEGECASLNCLCDDGRSVSSDACIAGCCVSAVGNEALRAEVCTELCEQLNPIECEVGELRCLEEGIAAVQRCTSNYEWTIESCPTNESCTLGQCLPNSCFEGQTLCLSSTDFAICQNDSWVHGGTCQGACAQDRCQSVACAQAVADKSYVGCEFVTLELPNIATAETHTPTAVVLVNPSETEEAFIQILGSNGEATPLINEQVIELPDVSGLPQTYMSQTVRSEVRDANNQVVGNSVLRADQINLPPRGTGTFLLPAAMWPNSGSLVKQVAHRVISDLPISASQFSPYCCNYSFSNDASLLLPTSTLGKNYRFIGVPTLKLNFSQGNQSYATNAVIVATRDQTQVRFTLPGSNLIQPETQGRISMEQGAYVVTLNQQETLLLRGSSRESFSDENIPQPDLTGTFIESNEPIAIFSGHECSFYPFDIRACDHLEEQLFPTDAWGTEFLLVPPKERGTNSPDELIYWKILAQGENANLSLSVPFSELDPGAPGAEGVPDCADLLANDGQTINLGVDGFCEFSTKRAFGLSSDQKLTIMGVISGQESVSPVVSLNFGNHYGDPSIFLVPPTHQIRSSYTFLTPATYHSNFVTITFNEGTTIVLDGQILNLSGAIPIQGSLQKYIHIELDDGGHTMSGNAPFSIMVYAYDDFVSYAFTGGLNLTSSEVNDTEMAGAEMAGAEMAGAEMAGAEMAGAEMAGAEMAGTEMAGTEMDGTEMLSCLEVLECFDICSNEDIACNNQCLNSATNSAMARLNQLIACNDNYMCNGDSVCLQSQCDAEIEACETDGVEMPPEPENCVIDLDCPIDTPRCIDNLCVECSLNVDCNFGNTCQQGSCVEEMNSVCMPDQYEPNNSFNEATPVSTTNLISSDEELKLCGDDNDYYLITVCASGTLTAVVTFESTIVDIDILLQLNSTEVLDRSNGIADSEEVNYTNLLSSTQDIYLHVYPYQPITEAAYRLELTLNCP